MQITHTFCEETQSNSQPLLWRYGFFEVGVLLHNSWAHKMEELIKRLLTHSQKFVEVLWVLHIDAQKC